MARKGFRASLQPPLTPSQGGFLRVLGVARVSKEEQTSLPDQKADYKRWLRANSDVPWKMKMLSTAGSGENLNRVELKRLRRLIEKRRIDLVLTEDLGRIVRRIRAIEICELCEDYGVRLIAYGDHVDTFADGWQDQSFFAAYRHEQHNKDLRRRICRSLRNRFDNGGAVRPPIFGIGLKESTVTDAKGRKVVTDDLLYKFEWAEPIYDEWFNKFEDGVSYSEVADWLDAIKAPLPQHAVKRGAKRWTRKLVMETTFNPILKGVRERNRKKSVRVNETGKYKTENAPAEELQQRAVPHLIFIEPARWDRVTTMLREKNAKYSVPGNSDPRKGRPKKRSRWPGQHLYCGICGRPFVYGAHGRKDHLVCSGARDYRCWQSISVSGPLAAQKMADAIYQEFRSLPSFDEVTRVLLEEEIARVRSGHQGSRQELLQKIRKNEQGIANLMDAIRDMEWSPSLKQQLGKLESEKINLQRQLDTLETNTDAQIVIPSPDVLRQMYEVAVAGLSLESWPFARLMRRLIPKIVVFPMQLIDGGGQVLRARFNLSLANISPNLSIVNGLEEMRRTLTVNLFDPLPCEEFREQIVRMIAKPARQRDVARLLGIGLSVVQRAIALERLLQAKGLTDPYVAVTTPPENCPKRRRHLHPRYCFDPLPDAGQL